LGVRISLARVCKLALFRPNKGSSPAKSVQINDKSKKKGKGKGIPLQAR